MGLLRHGEEGSAGDGVSVLGVDDDSWIFFL